MERYSDEAIRIIDSLHTERLDYHSEYIPLIDAAQRLAAYENTCLEPEDILGATDMAKVACALRELNKYKHILGDDYDIDRLRELVQADRDERCVIRPVKLCTPVWSSVFCRVDDDGIEHPTYPWEFDDSMLAEWGTGWHLTEEDALKAFED